MVEWQPNNVLSLRELLRERMGWLKNKTRKPNLYVIGGPNGSGKTTFAREFLPQDVKCIEFVNVDLIAGGLSPFAPERASLQAGRLMLGQIHFLANRGADFGFETTFSGKTYIKLFNDLKKRGYKIHLYFLWINNIELAIERIKTRVRNGGHDIPEDIVRRRFDKSLTNFLNYYQPLADSWVIFNNSEDIPQMVAFMESEKIEILDSELFKNISKQKEKR